MVDRKINCPTTWEKTKKCPCKQQSSSVTQNNHRHINTCIQCSSLMLLIPFNMSREHAPILLPTHKRFYLQLTSTNILTQMERLNRQAHSPNNRTMMRSIGFTRPPKRTSMITLSSLPHTMQIGKPKILDWTKFVTCTQQCQYPCDHLISSHEDELRAVLMAPPLTQSPTSTQQYQAIHLQKAPTLHVQSYKVDLTSWMNPPPLMDATPSPPPPFPIMHRGVQWMGKCPPFPLVELSLHGRVDETSSSLSIGPLLNTKS